MNLRFIKPIYIFAVLVLLGMRPGVFQAAAAQEKTPDVEKKVNVLTYGPIHEAFAETVVFDPEPGIIIPKAPPDAIDEIPPEQKPEGNVEWIPGYWTWDDERNDFIWVSGIWRVVPPGRQWIPGYWVKVEKGFQWVSGYWAAEKKIDTEYLPEPPETVEAGPNVSAHSPDYGWIPGCWIWLHGRYVWQPGYWAIMRPDWVWVPPYYTWTPRGYIFVEGYWDIALVHRGVLFAPVFFGFGVTMVHGFYFTPSIVIDLRVFSDCLFLRPGYHHYYFGDYYALKYYQRGIYPWFSLHARRHGYDPFYAHQRWEHRHDHNWENHLNESYQKRRKNEADRPSRRLYLSEKSDHKGTIPKASGRTLEAPFITVTKSSQGSSGFRSLSKKEHQQINRRWKEVDQYRKKRQNWESQKSAKPSEWSSSKSKMNRVRFPRSPVAAKPTSRIDKRYTPPNRYEVPRPNPAVEPLKRRFDGHQDRIYEHKPDNRSKNENVNRNRSYDKGTGSNGNQWMFDQGRRNKGGQ